MELVELVLKLRGDKAFNAALENSTKKVGKLGTTTEDSGKKSEGAWKKFGKFAAGSAALAGAGKYLKSAASGTEDLAKGTMTLQRTTGMDTKSASEWVSVLKTRGIGVKQFNVGMVALSKKMALASSGNTKAQNSFKMLNVSMDDVASGNTGAVIGQLSDQFASMTNPAEKAALAQKLFGKQGQTLLPMLSKGSGALQEQLDMADKYGATISGKTGEDVKKFAAQQRELKLAQDGVKNQLGQALIPVMLSASNAIVGLTRILSPLIKNSTALQVVLIFLVSAFTAYKLAVMISTLMTLSFNAALLLIPLAVVAIIAGLVLAYKKVGWFRDAVNAAWGAIKSGFRWVVTHWKLLVSILGGPLGAAVVLIATHFKDIKQIFVSAFNWIIGKAKGFVGFFKRLPGQISHAVGDMFGGIRHAFRSAINWVIGKWNNFSLGFDAVKIAGHTVIPGFHLNTPDLPYLAAGGVIRRSGAAVVGEAGPEVVRLPQAAEVVPARAAAAAIGGPPQTIVTQVFLDRRQIAEAVGNYTADRLARR